MSAFSAAPVAPGKMGVSVAVADAATPTLTVCVWPRATDCWPPAENDVFRTGAPGCRGLFGLIAATSTSIFAEPLSRKGTSDLENVGMSIVDQNAGRGWSVHAWNRRDTRPSLRDSRCCVGHEPWISSAVLGARGHSTEGVMEMKTAFMVAAAATALMATVAGVGTSANNSPKPSTIELLGEVIFPTGTTYEGTVVGGLSSITYDAARDVFYAISDDQSQINPARFYTLRMDIADGALSPGDVTFTGVTTLLAPDGQPYPAASLDPEGLTLTKAGELIVTSEGFAARNIAPWVRRYTLDGTYIDDLPVPDAFNPTAPTHGVRGNLGFEAAAVASNGRHLFVGTEGALVQDGPAADVGNGTAARILRYQLQTQAVDAQYVYQADAVAEAPVPATAFRVNGLVELLPFNDRFMLAMERSFSVGAPGTGNTIKLYTVAFPGADDVNGIDSLAGLDVRPVEKALLLDLKTLGIPLDNIEGMVIGPRLPDGRRSLILVSDNNFSAAPSRSSCCSRSTSAHSSHRAVSRRRHRARRRGRHGPGARCGRRAGTLSAGLRVVRLGDAALREARPRRPRGLSRDAARLRRHLPRRGRLARRGCRTTSR